MNLPPVIASKNDSAPGTGAAWAFGGMLCLIFIARFSVELGLALPFCAFQRIIGLPCPLCGSTRCLAACAHGHLADALRWNPLTFLACLAVVLWFAFWVADRFFNVRWLAAIERRSTVRALGPLLMGGVALNWLYLCLPLGSS